DTVPASAVTVGSLFLSSDCIQDSLSLPPLFLSAPDLPTQRKPRGRTHYRQQRHQYRPQQLGLRGVQRAGPDGRERHEVHDQDNDANPGERAEYVHVPAAGQGCESGGSDETKSRSACVKAAGRSMLLRWPAPVIASRLALAIAFDMVRESFGRVSASSAPTITRVGTVIVACVGVESGRF